MPLGASARARVRALVARARSRVVGAPSPSPSAARACLQALERALPTRTRPDRLSARSSPMPHYALDCRPAHQCCQPVCTVSLHRPRTVPPARCLSVFHSLSSLHPHPRAYMLLLPFVSTGLVMVFGIIWLVLVTIRRSTVPV